MAATSNSGKRISPNTEILIMIVIGVGTTILEESMTGVKDTLTEIWSLECSMLSSPLLENLLKSIVSGIVLARAFTVHLYLASYLLLIYPVIMEKMRLMLVFWLTLSAIRSIFINAIATITGFLLCSLEEDLRLPCFEFAAIKAIELACSVYMWVNVHEFYYLLKRGKTTKIRGSTSKKFKVQSLTEEGSFSSSDSVLLSKSLLDELSCSEESLEATLSEQLKAVEWFMKHVPGFSEVHHEQIFMDEIPDCAIKFMEMNPFDILEVQERLRKSLGLERGMTPWQALKLSKEIVKWNTSPVVSTTVKEDDHCCAWAKHAFNMLNTSFPETKQLSFPSVKCERYESFKILEGVETSGKPQDIKVYRDNSEEEKELVTLPLQNVTARCDIAIQTDPLSKAVSALIDRLSQEAVNESEK